MQLLIRGLITMAINLNKLRKDISNYSPLKTIDVITHPFHNPHIAFSKKTPSEVWSMSLVTDFATVSIWQIVASPGLWCVFLGLFINVGGYHKLDIIAPPS